MAAHGQLDRVGDHLARRQRRLHALVAHGDAVGHGDGAELARRAAGRRDALLDRLGLAHQRDVAGRGLVPAGRDADERLVDLLAASAPWRSSRSGAARARAPPSRAGWAVSTCRSDAHPSFSSAFPAWRLPEVQPGNRRVRHAPARWRRAARAWQGVQPRASSGTIRKALYRVLLQIVRTDPGLWRDRGGGWIGAGHSWGWVDVGCLFAPAVTAGSTLSAGGRRDRRAEQPRAQEAIKIRRRDPRPRSPAGLPLRLQPFAAPLRPSARDPVGAPGHVLEEAWVRAGERRSGRSRRPRRGHHHVRPARSASAASRRSAGVRTGQSVPIRTSSADGTPRKPPACARRGRPRAEPRGRCARARRSESTGDPHPARTTA